MSSFKNKTLHYHTQLLKKNKIDLNIILMLYINLIVYIDALTTYFENENI